MSSDLSGATPEISYAIRYEAITGRDTNPEFRGAGRLLIHPDGPTYFFSGVKRALFSRREHTLELRAKEISNVLVQGNAIRFNTPRGEAGRRHLPFVFFCTNADEAAAIASLLPAHLDEGFLEARDFGAKLARLSPGSHAWSSVTNGIVAVNLVVFGLMGLAGAGWLQTESMALYIQYANNGAATTAGEWWRLVTCMFMHYGLIHLAMNMWALHQTGQLVERLLGRPLYLLAYFGSGIVASFASILWHGDRVWSAGASGAVFGVYGVLLGYMVREKHGLPRSVVQPMLRSTLGFAAYNILFGLAHPLIDNAAHIGGFAGGFVFGAVLALPLDPEQRARLHLRRLGAGLLVLAALCATGVALTPRYDYDVGDEMRWNEAIRSFAAREPQLLKQQKTQFPSTQDKAARQAQAEWLETSLIPFYHEWSQQIKALTPKPGLATARRQIAMQRILELRIASYRQLAQALRRDDPEAHAQFKRDDDAVRRAIAEINQP